MSSDFDLIFCKDDDENDTIVFCLNVGTKTVVDSLYIGIEWTCSEDLQYHLACICREDTMDMVAEAMNAGLRVGLGEISGVEVLPARLH